MTAEPGSRQARVDEPGRPRNWAKRTDRRCTSFGERELGRFLAHEPHLKSRARGSARPSVHFGETSVHEEGLDIAEIGFFFSWTEK